MTAIHFDAVIAHTLFCNFIHRGRTVAQDARGAHSNGSARIVAVTCERDVWSIVDQGAVADGVAGVGTRSATTELVFEQDLSVSNVTGGVSHRGHPPCSRNETSGKQQNEHG